MNYAEQIPKSITFLHNGVKLYFGSYEQGREKHQGAKWDVVHLDEECPHDIYIELYRGTLRRHGRIVYTMTPLKGITYVTDDILKKCRDPENKNYWTPESPMTPYENKHLDPEEIRAFEEELDEKSIQSRIHGNAVALEGLVYSEFAHTAHVIDPFPIPDEWTLYRGIDFGWEHPTTSLICAYDGYTLYVISEYYKNHRHIQDHALHMKEQIAAIAFQSGHRQTPHLIVLADHDAQERAQYEIEGIYSEPAQKKVVEGIAVVRKLVKVHSDGHTRLKVFRQCTHTIEEFGRYHYPGEDTKGRLKPGEKADDPVKEWDHCLDPLRYIAVNILGYISWDASGFSSGGES
jgi:phage terminase large subunit-like protein